MKVSIIIPVYNVSDYVERCLRSVMAQTYTDIECLIVDDCTPDDSIEKCERMIAAYDGPITFKVLHHEKNRGLSAARNTGTNAATGDWVFYLDSDDTITSDAITILSNEVMHNPQIDMAVGNIIIEYVDNKHFIGSKLLLLDDGVYKNNILDLYLDNKIYTPSWNKLIKKDFIKQNNLSFEENLIHEDYLWSFLVACCLNSLSVTTKYTYIYYRRSNSLDTNENHEVHIINYSKACHLQAIYASKRKDLWNNSKIFKHIHNCRYSQIINAYRDGNVALCRSCYDLIRNTPFWNPIKLIKMKASKGEILLSFHHYIPRKFGFFYYMLFVKKLHNFQ